MVSVFKAGHRHFGLTSNPTLPLREACGDAPSGVKYSPRLGSGRDNWMGVGDWISRGPSRQCQHHVPIERPIDRSCRVRSTKSFHSHRQRLITGLTSGAYMRQSIGGTAQSIP